MDPWLRPTQAVELVAFGAAYVAVARKGFDSYYPLTVAAAFVPLTLVDLVSYDSLHVDVALDSAYNHQSYFDGSYFDLLLSVTSNSDPSAFRSNCSKLKLWRSSDNRSDQKIRARWHGQID